MKTAVCIARCPSYRAEDFEPALDRLLASLGGLGSFISPGDRVLLKPNCISPAGPATAVQTDPAVIVGLARRVVDLGATAVVGDSPAWGRMAGNLEAIGALRPLQRIGVEVVQFTRGQWLANYPMRIYRRFRIARQVLQADKVINLPKLKAHRQLALTAAIKNMFGCVAGKRKAWWHFRAGDSRNYFGWMLVELFDLLRPCLTIVDGVLAQEGDGPIRGQPRWLNWLVGGTDGVAIERVCAELVGYRPDELRTLTAAQTLGIGHGSLADIEVLGESLESQRIGDFARPQLIPIRFDLLRVVTSAVKNRLLHLRFGRRPGPGDAARQTDDIPAGEP